jgi:hypothetical protein
VPRWSGYFDSRRFACEDVSVRPVGEDEEKQALLGIIQNLREDKAHLVTWAAEEIEQLSALTQQTSDVRELPGELVRDSSRQGSSGNVPRSICS